MTILKSKLDASVNFIEEQLAGFLESRYVRRCKEYFVCYLSSHTGCKLSCRQCHLTATGQTSFVDCDYQDFLNQALQVFRHYRREDKAEYVNFSFMARGEFLANKHLLNDADKILRSLADLATEDGLRPKFNISTIMPKSFDKSLCDVFKVITPTIYYSLYSVNEEFKRKWMPAAMPVSDALDMLKEYQKQSRKIIKIHHPFIKGENDSFDDVEAMCDLIESKRLICEFNLVRYNPFSMEQGEESDEATLYRNLKLIERRFPGTVKEIQRVGQDCKASCGMFVDSDGAV